MAEDFSSPPSGDRTISDLVNWLEGLYQTLLNLTEKAEERAIEIDKQMAIETTRNAILEEADQVLEEVDQALSRESDLPDTDIDWMLLSQKKEKLVSLAKQIQVVDQRRIILFKEEQAVIQQILLQFNVGKQAVSKYQQSLPESD